MTVRNAVWRMAEDWVTPSEIASASGYRKASVLAALRSMEAEGKAERRFVDGIGDQVRRIGEEPASRARHNTGTILLARLSSGPKTTTELNSSIPDISQSAVRMALRRLEAQGLVTRERDREPHLWRLVRWSPGQGRSTSSARDG
jgi:DNA-binding MarR family transcriptional regulator